MDIAGRLRKARQEKGLSSEEVAKLCGITRSAVQMYEAGLRVPRDSIKVVLAKVYGKSISELFFYP